MIKDTSQDSSKDFFKEACDELNKLGYKLDINPRNLKESYNLTRQPDGSWFKSTKLSLHNPADNILLDLNLMPALKKLIGLIEEAQPDITKQSARIFITEHVVYQIKKGTESPILINNVPGNTSLKKIGKFSKACDELNLAGHEKDRFRIEETYLITKTANGLWSASTSHTNHSGREIILDLDKMPNLKNLTKKINSTDSSFSANGGRVFITPTRIYRIKNKIEINFKF